MNINPKATRILCFGDSNTRGFIPGSMGTQRHKANERWTGVLQNLLGNDYEVIEEGQDGRTINIETENKNSMKFLSVILGSHRPLDWIIIFLGTNDLKNKFNKTPEDIADGLKELVQLTNDTLNEAQDNKFKILILSPAIVDETVKGVKEDFIGAQEKSKSLGILYSNIAREFRCDYIILSEYISSSKIDGYHLDKNAHQKIGEIVADKILNN